MVLQGSSEEGRSGSVLGLAEPLSARGSRAGHVPGPQGTVQRSPRQLPLGPGSCTMCPRPGLQPGALVKNSCLVAQTMARAVFF